MWEIILWKIATFLGNDSPLYLNLNGENSGGENHFKDDLHIQKNCFDKYQFKLIKINFASENGVLTRKCHIFAKVWKITFFRKIDTKGGPSYRREKKIKNKISCGPAYFSTMTWA